MVTAVVATTIRAEVRMRARPTSTRRRMRTSPRMVSARRPSSGPSSRASIRAAFTNATTTMSAEGWFRSCAETDQRVGESACWSRRAAKRRSSGPIGPWSDAARREEGLFESGRAGHVVADHLGPRRDRLGAGHHPWPVVAGRERPRQPHHGAGGEDRGDGPPEQPRRRPARRRRRRRARPRRSRFGRRPGPGRRRGGRMRWPRMPAATSSSAEADAGTEHGGDQGVHRSHPACARFEPPASNPTRSRRASVVVVEREPGHCPPGVVGGVDLVRRHDRAVGAGDLPDRWSRRVRWCRGGRGAR